MRYIDMQTWPRRDLFKLFNSFDHPHFGMSANVDLTAFRPAVKQRGYPISLAITYVISRAANAIPEFRYRIRGDDVVEHDVVHPSITVATDNGLFCFCDFEYVEDLSTFVARAAERTAYVRTHPCLEDQRGDEQLYMTAIPWVSFTAFLHPLHLHPPDSIPRFAWGKFFQEGELLKMPLGVQGHHALMDGMHVGQFYTGLQEYLDHPDLVLGEG